MVELMWDGKYNANGKRVAPLRVALPFQTVETVNESAQQRQYARDLFAAGRDSEWRNRLIWVINDTFCPPCCPNLPGKSIWSTSIRPLRLARIFLFRLR